MRLAVGLFVLCVFASAAARAAAQQSEESNPVDNSERSPIRSDIDDYFSLYSPGQAQPHRKGMLTGCKSLPFALGTVVGFGCAMILSSILWTWFSQVRKREGRRFGSGRLAGGSSEGGEAECQQYESNGGGSGNEKPKGPEEEPGEDTEQDSEEESADEETEEEEGESGEETGEKFVGADEEEPGREVLQFDPENWMPRGEYTTQWVDMKISECRKELVKRQQKLGEADQMTVDLKEHIDQLQELFERVCEVRQKEDRLRTKFFALEALVEHEGDLADELSRTRTELRHTQEQSTVLVDRFGSALVDLKYLENLWCKEHGQLPIHEPDPGFKHWGDLNAEFISSEDIETQRRKEAFERGEDVYIASERLNKKRITKLEVSRSAHKQFLEAQSEYFQKKQQAEEAPGRADLNQAKEEARRKLYAAKHRAEVAFKEHFEACIMLVSFEHDWCVAHDKEPPADPYLRPL